MKITVIADFVKAEKPDEKICSYTFEELDFPNISLNNFDWYEKRGRLTAKMFVLMPGKKTIGVAPVQNNFERLAESFKGSGVIRRQIRVPDDQAYFISQFCAGELSANFEFDFHLSQ